MAAIPVRRPTLLQQFGNMRRQKPPVTDGANSFKAGDIVQISAGALQLVPTNGVLAWGQTPDDSKAAGLKPPEAFFGENHYCFDLHEAIIEMNITNTAGGVGDSVVNNGAAGPTLSSVVIGAVHPIKTDCANFVGVQLVNTSVNTTPLVTVVGIAPNQTTADNNPRVLFRIPQNLLQF